MKILLFMKDIEKAETVFRKAISVIKDLKIGCEIRYQTDSEAMLNELSNNIFAYDTIILHARDKEATQVAQMIRRRNFHCSLILMRDEEGIGMGVLKYRLSYLLPEGNVDLLKKAIAWAFSEQNRIHPYFTVKTKETIIKIQYASIDWFESRQRTVILHEKGRDIVFYAKLSEVYEQIPKDMFLRCHQSYIVNAAKIKMVDKAQHVIVLLNGTTVEISKSYYADVLRFYECRA